MGAKTVRTRGGIGVFSNKLQRTLNLEDNEPLQSNSSIVSQELSPSALALALALTSPEPEALTSISSSIASSSSSSSSSQAMEPITRPSALKARPKSSQSSVGPEMVKTTSSSM